MRRRVFGLILFLIPICLFAQQPDAVYKVNYFFTGKDSLFTASEAGLQKQFSDSISRNNYINQLAGKLYKQGWPAASVDSIASGGNELNVWLYTGPNLLFKKITPVAISEDALQFANFRAGDIEKRPINILRINDIQKKLVNFYANKGYPFASAYLDSIRFFSDGLTAILKVDTGYSYLLDSVHIVGDVKLNDAFLYKYLQIQKAGLYNSSLISAAEAKLARLPFVNIVQASDVTMLGTGSFLNVYLNRRKNNVVNFLVGLMPGEIGAKKYSLSGDVNLLLHNSFANAETIRFNWQQLQPKSPRLHLAFDQPFVFESNFGLNLLLDLFKKDSSFLLLTARAGTNFMLNEFQSGKIFAEWQTSSLQNGVLDTNQIKQTGKLPEIIDSKSAGLGFSYSFNNTNYRLNPRKGWDATFQLSSGIKRILKSNEILGIKDPAFDAENLYGLYKPKMYQLRFSSQIGRYIPIGKYSTLKAAMQSGWYSSESIFRNDLFMIGGFNSIRGFNEQSVYASQFNILTAEYRFLIGTNSYLFAFTEGAQVFRKDVETRAQNMLFSGGTGILVESKAGLINLSFAVGKTSGETFKFGNASKIHFGFINYF